MSCGWTAVQGGVGEIYDTTASVSSPAKHLLQSFYVIGHWAGTETTFEGQIIWDWKIGFLCQLGNWAQLSGAQFDKNQILWSPQKRPTAQNGKNRLPKNGWNEILRSKQCCIKPSPAATHATLPKPAAAEQATNRACYFLPVLVLVFWKVLVLVFWSDGNIDCLLGGKVAHA